MATQTSELKTWGHASTGGTYLWQTPYSDAQEDGGATVVLNPAPVVGHGVGNSEYITAQGLVTALPLLSQMNSVDVYLKVRAVGGLLTALTDLYVYLIGPAGAILTGVNAADATPYDASYTTVARTFTMADLVTLGIDPSSNADFNDADFGFAYAVLLADDSVNL